MTIASVRTSNATGNDINLNLAAAKVIWPVGQIMELRVLKGEIGKDYTATLSGYFDEVNKMIAEAGKIKAEGLYVTINPVNPALIARCKNRVKHAGTGDSAKSDHDISYRRWLLLDIDPSRPSGICATDQERIAVKITAEPVIR